MQTITFDEDVWQLVPKEPTSGQSVAMSQAYWKLAQRPEGVGGHDLYPVDIYRAMLAAAPSPPAAKADEFERVHGSEASAIENGTHDRWMALRAAKAEPSAEAVELLRRAAEYIGEGGHGDNCYVSRQYAGDPGDQCNCGKESMCDAIDSFLAALDSRKEREGG